MLILPFSGESQPTPLTFLFSCYPSFLQSQLLFRRFPHRSQILMNKDRRKLTRGEHNSMSLHYPNSKLLKIFFMPKGKHNHIFQNKFLTYQYITEQYALDKEIKPKLLRNNYDVCFSRLNSQYNRLKHNNYNNP